MVVELQTALLTGGLAVVGSFLANYLIHYLQIVAHKKTVEAALVSEVNAIKTISDARGYLSSLKKILKRLKDSPPETRYPFQVNSPSHYSRIYQQLAKDIGLLTPEMAGNIVTFHQLIDSIVQDISPGGILYNGAEYSSFQETVKLFIKAEKLAVEIDKNHREKL